MKSSARARYSGSSASPNEKATVFFPKAGQKQLLLKFQTRNNRFVKHALHTRRIWVLTLVIAASLASSGCRPGRTTTSHSTSRSFTPTPATPRRTSTSNWNSAYSKTACSTGTTGRGIRHFRCGRYGPFLFQQVNALDYQLNLVSTDWFPRSSSSAGCVCRIFRSRTHDRGDATWHGAHSNRERLPAR